MSASLEDKKARLRSLLEKRQEAVQVPRVEPRGQRAELEPLSFAQQGLWFVSQLEGPNSAYNIAVLARLFGHLDVDALGWAISAIVRRHDTLRTRFVEQGGVPGQALSDLAEVRLEPRQVDPDEAEAAYRREAQRPFDIAGGRLFRTALFTDAPERFVLVVTMHHSISDAWSVGVFLRELMALYEARAGGRESALAPLAVTYADYVHWEKAWLESGVLERQLAYWKRQLADLPPLLTLPTDRPRPALQSTRGATVHYAAPRELLERIRSLANEQKSSLFLTLVAALSVLLERHASQTDLAIGTSVANRRSPELEALVGYFVNTVVLRAHVTEEQSFASVMKATREVVLQALANQDTPFHRVVEELRPERSLGHSPVFQVMITLQNVPYSRRIELSSVAIEAEIPDSGSAKFDLSFEVQEEEAALRGQIEYRSDLFDGSTVLRLADHFVLLLAQVAEQPERRLSDITLIGAAERHQLLVEWNDAGRSWGDGPAGPTAWDLLAAQAGRTPGAPAMAGPGARLTYSELRQRVEAAAARLAGHGVGPGVVVALLAERGVDLWLAALAVLAAGGAYVPLDPRHPAERQARVTSLSGAPLALVGGDLGPGFERAFAGAVVPPPRFLPLAAVLDGGGPTAAARRAGPGDLAYVIYTSGSTGEPKGVMVEHRGMLNHLRAKVEDLGLSASDAVAQTASQCFDISVWQVLAPLLVGGTVHVLPDEVAHEPRELVAAVEAAAITVLEVVPSLLRLLLDEIEARGSGLRSLRWMIPTGEALPPDLGRRWLTACPAVPLLNAYGPTECSDDVSHHRLDTPPPPAVGSVPIGRPVVNTRLFVLDRDLLPVPLGVVGELCVAGTGVGRGYLNEPARTAEAFTPEPFGGEPGARLYRTGDLARWLPAGRLEFLGRRDHQVKIRGHRIELGEIEERLRAHPAVSDTAVLAREDRPGEKRLVAYVVGEEGGAPDVAVLREHVAAGLPEYMLPSVFVLLPALPLTANGKLDRKALPAPDEGDFQRGGYVAPRTELERRLCEVWQEVLAVERVGIDDDFFDLGGHSLLATQVVSRVRSALGRELPLKAMFEQRTVRGLCERLPEAGGGLVLPEIEVLARRERLPLSYAQQRLWFIDRLEGGSSHYNIPSAARMRGALDKEAFAAAVRTLVERHESLRTVFHEKEGEPYQVIRGSVEVPLEEKDLSGVPVEERERAVRQLALESVLKAFDLSRDPLLRVILVRMSDEEHVVLFNMHHIISDGWSMGVLANELGALYEAYRSGRENPLPPLRVQYADYAHWQRQWLRGEVLEGQLAYWRRELAGLPSVHGVPLDKPRPARQGFDGGEHVERLGAELKGRFDAFSRDRGVTLFMVLQAAFAVLLGRYSHETDVVVGSPIAGRVHRDMEPLIGFFVNTLVLRSDLSGNPRFVELLEAGRRTVLDAYDHQHAPFEMLVGELKPERSLSHSPLFQILIVLQNAERGDGLEESRLEPVGGGIGVVKFDLELNLVELADDLILDWWYKKELFHSATIERMASSFRVLLQGILERPEERIEELPLLTGAELRHLRSAGNGREAPYPRERSVPELFEAQVERSPDAVALVFAQERLTYRELNERANRLADALLAQGVGPETLVGLCVERSPEMLAGLLGILKAGGAYLPLDPDYPEARLSYMLEDSAARMVLTTRRLSGLASFAGRRTLALDDPALAAPPAGPAGANPERRGLRPRHLAYVIYTSGSTGRPKGVTVEHGQLVHTLSAGLDELGWEAEDRIPCLAPFSFDIFLFELLSPWLAGGSCELVPLTPSLDLDRLVARLPEMTRLHAVPAVMAQIVDLAGRSGFQFPRLRTLFVGGDAVPADLLARMREVFPAAELRVLYGPTEATIIATSWRVAAGERPSASRIGRPLPNVEIRVCDRAGSLVPTGVSGELRIGGPGVARGYLGRPELTAERFVPDPLAEGPGAPGARLYRSGDLVRRLDDGSLEFLGRIDHQVKVRGFRIELGEIEAQLQAQDAVREAVVLARDDGAGGRRLVGYVVPSEESGNAALAGELKSALQKSLPDYMVPSVFVVLPALPLTAHGKVDRRALPSPDEGDLQRGEHVAPRTELERRLCEIWAEILGVERVGIDDSFFDLGGHSLLATRVVSRVRSALGLELPLRALFENPTIRGLCDRLPEPGGELALPAIEVVADRQGLPLSYAQQRLWFIDRLEGGSSHYNVAGGLRVRGGLDKAAFAAALRTIVERHEPLRTVFREERGEVFQVIRQDADFAVNERDLSGLGAEAKAREVRHLAWEEAQTPFDLSRDLLLRVSLLKLSEEEHVVLSTMHHIASDGWSVGVLARELEILYAAYRAGEESPLPPLVVQYADYACWQRQWLRGGVLDTQLDYWRRELAGVPQVHGLPLDRPRPARQGFAGGEHAQLLSGPLRTRIEALCRERGVTLFMLLQAAFAVLLSRYSRETDIVAGSPIAGRVHRDVEPLIGFFVNTLVLRSDLSGAPRFVDLLAASRRMILDAYAHQHVPFEMLVEDLKPERSLSHNPLFQILIALQNADQDGVRLGGSPAEPLDGAGGIVKFDLELNVRELEEGLALDWWFKKELFDDATIERMASSFGVLLEGLLAAPEESIGALPLLSAPARRSLLSLGSFEVPYPRESSIHELFEAQAKLSPEAVAVSLDDARLTYRELDERANRLAHLLIAQGVRTETLVGLCTERSLEMVAGILGILKAGGAYLPLDPEYPEARLATMLDDAAVEVVLTQSRLAGMRCFAGCRTVPLDDPRLTVGLAGGNPGLSGWRPRLRSSGLAYVIYTSGSTGRPKGAMVEHRSVVRLVIHPDFVPLCADTVMLQASSVSFDAATLEIWGPLLNGGRLVLYPERVPEIERLNAEIERHGVNTLWLTAGLFDQWSYQVPPSSPLKWVLTGGDVVDPSSVARVYEALAGVQVINGYGPTENTTFTACHSIPRGGEPHRALPLGRPIHGTGVVVLEDDHTLAAPGAVGELCAFGDGVARGYLDRPALTAERFIAHPYTDVAGSRLYRTGDLARWRADGTLEFLGRVDHQVKIRGFRIELGEIEAQLRSQAAVQEAVVVAREEGAGGKRLVAYVVGAEGRAPEVGALREGLAAKLPEHMIPSVFVALPALPLTPNGKVDRRALPAPEEEDFQRGDYVAPRTELERRLCEIWQEVLGVERVGIADSFFDLGGHSLLATRVVSRVRSALGRELPLRALFENPTVRGLCERLPQLGGGLVLPPIEVVAEREGLPLSYAQQRLWFIDRLEGGSSQYNIAGALRLRGALDTAALAAAFRMIVERHESLRTVFREVKGEGVQVILEGVEFRLAESDLSRLPDEEREREVRRLALADARRPFDLSRDLPLRVALLKLSGDEHVVLPNMHHIASDGWSIGVLLRELRALYEASRAGQESPLPPLRVQYADYAHWQRRWLRGEVLEDQLGYWRRQLDGLPQIHGLPLDKPRPAQQGFDGGEHVERLGRDFAEGLEALCRERGVTLFMVLQAAFAVLLGRYSREWDIVVGSPIAGRVHRDLEPLIGFFVNTLVLRSDLSGNPRFVDLLEASRTTILDAYAHQHVPFEMLVEELEPERSLRHSPLFQILIVLQNTGRAEMRLGDSRFEPLDGGSGIVKFDLELSAEESDEGLLLGWSYKRELFHAATIERMASSFGVLLRGLLENPEERIRSLPVLTEVERRSLLSAWSDREAPYPRERSIHELFEEQVARSPGAVAVVSAEGALTYGELNERSNRLARSLIALGVRTETLVGLYVERAPEMVVGLLGILKAGGAYLPLDPEYPEQRLETMLDDSGVEVVLTQSRLAGRAAFSGRRTVTLDDPGFTGPAGGNPGLPSGPGSLAYVIYTSGSTGQPKGAMVEHQSVVRLVINPDYVPLDADTVMLQASSVSFDAATLEIWGPLLNGGRLVLYPERVPEIERLNAEIERHGVNTLWLTAGLFDQWSYQVPPSSPLKWVLTGGDVVDPSAVARVYETLADIQVINGYGPTENTTFTACYSIPRGWEPHRALPLGRPINGTGVVVLQEDHTPAALGAVGELCALGDGVARGYLNRPALTAERFIANPYVKEAGARLYRTGDLARWRVDGTLEFLGRMDHQVKVRGFRVELGEIEAQLQSQASVREAIVLAREDGAGGKRLVGYVVLAEGAEKTALPGELPRELKTALQRTLPDHMIPAVFVLLPALPLTPNGKVDRRALPAPEEEDLQRGAYVAPRTELERRLCEIWAEILGVGQVGIEDDFFALGGHSLLATRVVSQVRAALGRELPLRALFENPTIQGLCKSLPELGGGLVLPPIEAVAERVGLPLSYAQQRLWFIDRLEGGSSSQYNMPGALRVLGALDEEAFAAALRTIVARHESLRTTFREVDGAAVQVIHEDAPFVVTEMDLRELGGAEREREVGRLALEDARKPFDLGRDLPLRVSLLRLAEDEHVVLSNMHHIASDGWSIAVLMRELRTLYAAYRAGEDNPLPPLSVQYADYACWQRQWLRGEVLDGQLGYWRRQLEGAPVVHGLPLDHPRPARQGFAGGEHAQPSGADLRDRIEALCRERGVTLFMFLQAAFSALLSRYSHETDVVMGSPIAGRVHRDVEPLIGFFVNTLVLRSDLAGAPRFADLLEAGKRTILDAYAHQHVPFEMLVEELKPERSLSHGPLFQIWLALQNTEQSEMRLGPSRLETLAGSAGAVKFDLELSVEELDAGLLLSWLYKKELFDGATIERMAGHFAALLTALAEDAGAVPADLPLLAAAEREQMLVTWNDTGAPAGGELCLHELFAARAGEAPEAVALVDGEREMSYGELAAEARRLAEHLRSLGVGPERIVGVCLERTAGMVVALLAVLEAGGAYLPLDPAHPRARLERVLADSGAAVVVTQESLVGQLPWNGPAVVLERDREAIARHPLDRPASGVSRENLAYVLFTSGSTGTPKGVAVTHRSAVEMVLWAGRVFSPEDLSGVLAATSLSFDLSVFELFVPLSWGGTVILAANALALPSLPAASRVRLVNTVPSALAELVRTGALPAGVRTVNLAGEPLPRALADAIWTTGTVEALWNLYGPSEDTTYSTFAAVERAASTPPRIGRPIAATQAYVVDSRDQPVPLGVAGELWLGGAGLARGYLGRPDLTAERFIPDPFWHRTDLTDLTDPTDHRSNRSDPTDRSDAQPTGARLYRTGDLVRWPADGELEYLGRIDHQVKVRGFRIELGEVEAALASHPDVRESVVLAREDQPGDKRLVAYVAGGAGTAELREHLRGRLPEYMIPPVFVALDTLPRTSNGKVDRKALPAPSRERGDDAPLEPRTPVEEMVAAVWAEVLGVERVDPRESFFELGGHSLLAMRVLSRLRRAFGVEIPLRELFEVPTVPGLARRVEAALRGSAGLVAPPIVPVPREGRLPLSFAQQRLWFLEQLEPGRPIYHIPVAQRVEGELRVEILAAALAEVVRRHEVLRTTFAALEGEPFQVISPAAGLLLPLVDLSALPEPAREAVARSLAGQEAARPFDLARGPLLRVLLLRLGSADHAILLTLHHIVTDGWSMGVLVREVAELYQALATGETPRLPELPVQYADVAVWERGWLQGEVLERQIAYWRGQLAGLPPLLELPTDRLRPPVQSFRGGNRSVRLAPELAEGLRTLARREGATLFMVLLAGFQALLSRLSGQEDLAVGTPSAGRHHLEVESLIGFFVNTLVLRGDLSGAPGLRGLLERARETTLAAHMHQEVPFERLVEELSPERSLAHAPLFQVMLALQNVPGEAPSLGALRPLPWDAEGGATAKFDLTLALWEEGSALAGNLEYGTDLFDAETMDRLRERFERLLSAAVADPEAPLADLPLLAAAEREQMLVAWNDTGSPAGGELCLHELFAARAERSPDAVALVDGERELTYGELAAEALRLAHHLRSLGVGPERIVGVCLERTAGMVVALLAVLEAGGAYLPLDPAHPRARLERVLADSGAAVVVTQESLADLLPWSGSTVVLERDRDATPRQPVDRPVSGVSRENLAYVLFTSGSTGTPKGVAVTHRSAVEMVLWAGRVFSPEDLSGVLAATSLSFDLSVFELFVPLVWGGTVILAANALALPSLPAASRVRLVNTVPSALAELVRMGGLPAGVRTVNLAGEPLPRALADRIWATGTVEALWNLYGPSEDTTYSTFSAVERASASAPRIGRPVTATQAYVVDRRDQPVPSGVAGELRLGGAGLARGYLGRPDLTAERFLPDPFVSGPSGAPGARLYRTGDLVRWLADGELDYLGRIDHQVKVRGFRIELGEVETALAAHGQVREAVVLAREDQPGDHPEVGPGGRRLVAYVAGDAGAAELRAHLGGRLPEYMIPSLFVPLDALPRTPNGKVDRKALPAPREERAGQEAAYVPPRDTLELELVRLWEETLGVQPIGVQDSFFTLGGHSLLAVRLVARMARRLGRELSVLELFQHPAIESLARHLRSQEAKPASSPSSPIVALQAAGHRRPFFCVHPGGGTVLAYIALSRHLGPDRPFYGLQAPEPRNGNAPHADTVEAMAGRYVAALREVQPAGPYLLGGWSLGGVVAYEMARQLREAGEEIELLALIDAHVPRPGSDEDGDLPLLATFARNLGLSPEELPVTAAQVRAMSPDERLAVLVDAGRRLRVLPPDVGVEGLTRLFRVFTAHVEAMERYVPGPFDGCLILYRAVGETANGNGHDALGWQHLALRGVEVREIQGTHFTVLREPAVRELAARLAEDLP